MSEEAELRAKIAALSGRINQQRQSGSAPTTPTYAPPAGRGSGYYPRGRGAGWAGQYAPDRYAPYHQPRGFSHKPVYAPSYRNRSLVVNSSVGSPAGQPASPATPAPTSSDKFVSKRDRHMQLINTSVYDQKTQQRQLEIEATLREKQQLRDAKEKARVMGAFQPQQTASTTYGAGTDAVRDIQINNLRFRVAADGSKLMRMFGMCAHGNRCRYTHDPNKIAVCKDFLRSGRCAAGDACNLSHETTPHRVPACTHFLRGNCTNPDCRYAHVAVNPAAPACRAFGTIGYCEKGADCTERHVFECPDYANTAGNMRKAKSAEAKMDDAETSDLSSDEESYDEIDYDDVDSDNFSDNEVMGGTDERDHELSQQQDYVRFS
ncbi:hypothetical protein KCU65_g1525, partial [Aureobasidium melanogenum]